MLMTRHSEPRGPGGVTFNPTVGTPNLTNKPNWVMWNGKITSTHSLAGLNFQDKVDDNIYVNIAEAGVYDGIAGLHKVSVMPPQFGMPANLTQGLMGTSGVDAHGDAAAGAKQGNPDATPNGKGWEDYAGAAGAIGTAGAAGIMKKLWDYLSAKFKKEAKPVDPSNSAPDDDDDKPDGPQRDTGRADGSTSRRAPPHAGYPGHYATGAANNRNVNQRFGPSVVQPSAEQPQTTGGPLGRSTPVEPGMARPTPGPAAGVNQVGGEMYNENANFAVNPDNNGATEDVGAEVHNAVAQDVRDAYAVAIANPEATRDVQHIVEGLERLTLYDEIPTEDIDLDEVVDEVRERDPYDAPPTFTPSPSPAYEVGRVTRNRVYVQQEDGSMAIVDTNTVLSVLAGVFQDLDMIVPEKALTIRNVWGDRGEVLAPWLGEAVEVFAESDRPWFSISVMVDMIAVLLAVSDAFQPLLPQNQIAPRPTPQATPQATPRPIQAEQVMLPDAPGFFDNTQANIRQYAQGIRNAADAIPPRYLNLIVTAGGATAIYILLDQLAPGAGKEGVQDWISNNPALATAGAAAAASVIIPPYNPA